MRAKNALIVAAGICATLVAGAATAGTCYIVFDRSENVIYRGPLPPIDLSDRGQPDRDAMRRRGEHLVAMESDRCPGVEFFTGAAGTAALSVDQIVGGIQTRGLPPGSITPTFSPQGAGVPSAPPSAAQPRPAAPPPSVSSKRTGSSTDALPRGDARARWRRADDLFVTPVLQARVWRGGASGHFVDYEVPRQPNQTILDVVTWIQRHLDPTLAYRFACRVGMCGSCAMTVNGVPRWTCRTHVTRVAHENAIEIAPLAHLPVVRDLVTDMREFFDKWARARGQFHGTRSRHDDFAQIAPTTPARAAAEAGIECIGCGVCYAACDVVGWRPDYLGPAALNRAWTLHNDARDDAQGERLRAVAGDAGCHSCHTQGSCAERCPKHIAPTAGIAGLKRAAARAAIRGEL